MQRRCSDECDAETTSARALPAGLEWLASGARRGNSNNWVLAGGRTKGGRPILANDPHLQIEFPSVWYEMHLVASGLDVMGVTIPGVPFIALGHNARIAWGMTATGADVQDLAVERVDIGKKRSMYRGEWVPIETIQADIPVRGRSVPLPFEIWKTRNGPIFAADRSRLGSAAARGSRRTVVPPRSGARSRFAGRRAAIWPPPSRRSTAPATGRSFTAAIASFAAPSMNIVYADVDGNVGYAMSGRLPVRGSGDGTMPADGNAAPVWTGMIERRRVAARVQSAVGPHLLGEQRSRSRVQGPRSRATGPRASARRGCAIDLSNAQGVDLDAMAALQNDRHSVAADAVLAGAEAAAKQARSREGDRARGVSARTARPVGSRGRRAAGGVAL